MKKLKNLVIVIILFTNMSCNLLSDVKKISHQYYFDVDQILFVENGDYKGIGTCVIPPRVFEYELKKNYIFVKSRNNKNVIVYWIIVLNGSKKLIQFNLDSELYPNYHSVKNVFGPLDSLQLESKKDSLNFR